MTGLHKKVYAKVSIKTHCIAQLFHSGWRFITNKLHQFSSVAFPILGDKYSLNMAYGQQPFEIILNDAKPTSNVYGYEVSESGKKSSIIKKSIFGLSVIFYALVN